MASPASQADEAATTYTDNGRVETVTDAEGNRTTYVYDGHDRLAAPASRRRRPANVSSTTDYEEPTYATATVGGAARSTPLVASRLLRDGDEHGYGYDALGRLTARPDPPRLASRLSTLLAYDHLGRLTVGPPSTACRRPHGTSASPTTRSAGRPSRERPARHGELQL